MADAMVTARMSKQKKDEGNRILEQLGTNPSQAINDLYDYVIREKKLPYQTPQEFGWQKYTPEQIAQARMLAEESVIRVDQKYRTMTTKDAKRERLLGELAAEKESA